jgi:hypothetical protein
MALYLSASIADSSSGLINPTSFHLFDISIDAGPLSDLLSRKQSPPPENTSGKGVKIFTKCCLHWSVVDVE